MKLSALAVAMLGFFGSQPVYAISAADCAAMGSSCVAVSTAAQLSAALGATGTATTILMLNDITLTSNITVELATTNRKDLVIDGGGFTLAVGTNAFTFTNQQNASWEGNGSFTLSNMAGLTSSTALGNYVVKTDVGATKVNLVFDNIGSLTDSMLAVLGNMGSGVAPDTNSQLVLGNITQPIALTFGTNHQLAQASNVKFTGQLALNATTGAYPAVFWTNSANDYSVITFTDTANVSITTPIFSNGATGNGNYKYTFADGAQLALNSDQNVFGSANNGITIGTYDPLTGFGSGAVLQLATQSGGAYSAANAISNVGGGNTGGTGNGPTQNGDVIYNLAAGSSLNVSGSGSNGILATKTGVANSGNIYISSGALINAGGTGISVADAGTGTALLVNTTDGVINAPTGISATNTGTAVLNVENHGTINSSVAGIAVSSTPAQTVSVDNTGGAINATAGTGINVLSNAQLALFGGNITTTGAATGLTFAGTSGNHTISDVTINLNGSGAAFSKAAGVNLTLGNTTLNTVNGTALSSLSGLTFANSTNGRNTINVTGTGTGIAALNTDLSVLDPAALDINVSGAGTGVSVSGGGVDFTNTNLNLNVTNSGATALRIADGVSNNTTTIGSATHLNAAGATAISFSGTAAKTLNNSGTIEGDVTFAGTAANIINNYGVLDGVLSTGSGNDTLLLGSTSQSKGAINLGDGNNTVTIQNGASVASITTGSGNDTFNISNMTAGSTYLGILNAGSGTNTLNLTSSVDALATTTSLQGFSNINLADSQITLADSGNVGSGTINIDDGSELLFGSTFNGSLNAALGHVATGDGSAIISNGANVSLSQASAFAGDWQINQGGTLTANNGNQLGTAALDLAGTLNLNGVGLVNNTLTGAGLLNVDGLNNPFAFGSNAGSAFTGTVNLQDSTFALNGANTTALSNATLKLSGGNLTSVADGVQRIGALDMNAGTLLFDHIVDNSGKLSSLGTITADTLDVRQGGNVQLNLPDHITPSLEGLSAMELDNGVVLMTLASGAATGTGRELNLMDMQGNLLGNTVYQDIYNTGATAAAAVGALNYGLTTGNNYDGLYVSYGLQSLELLAHGSDALVLAAALADNGTQANDLAAQVTGSGDLAFASANDGSTASLSNANNSYTGATLVRSGNLRLDADSALGQTSRLEMDSGTQVDLNGTSQTIGEWLSAANSNLNFNQGILTVIAGGQVDGALSGDGELRLTGGTLNITQANKAFTGNTAISRGASAYLNHVQGLGNGTINNQGTLELADASGVLANTLTGSTGNVLLSNGTNVQLAGNNMGYSGLFSTDEGTVLTANTAQNLGSSSVVNNGELILDTDSAWTLVNSISGNGALIKTGEGTVKIEGDTVSASLTTIANGLLQLGSDPVLTTSVQALSRMMSSTSNMANLISDVLIATTGSLGGYGQVTGNVMNQGKLLMPNALTGGEFGSFTINGDYTGNNGTVVFNTVLAGDTSATDKLVISGNSAGQSYVTVNNIGGNGARTTEGIKIIDVAGDSAGQFILNGRAVAGAYEYFLEQGGISTPDDGDWYLRSQAENLLRPESASYTANLAAANNMFVSQLADRAGETPYTDAITGEKKTTSMWLRNEGSHNRFRDDSGLLKTQDNRYVMQLGGDIAQWSHTQQDLWRVGAMAGYANSSNSSVAQETGYRSTGSVNGYNLGLYGTWYADSSNKLGTYVDTWAQYGWFKNQIDGQDLNTEKYNSKGFTTSVEGGYTFALAEHYFIQPKAQAIWMGVKADDHRESNGTQVSGEGNGNIKTRLGIKAFMTGQPENKADNAATFKPFIEANWLHNSKDFGTTLDDSTVKQAGAKNIAELKLGTEGQVNKQLNLWGNIGQQVGNSGYNETSLVLGVKYNF